MFGDIHSNHEALDAVLTDMEKQKVTDRICMGDIVGYAAEPSRCLATVRQLGCPIVMGNHDREGASETDLSDYRELARVAMEHTRKALSTEEKNFLKSLPYVLESPDFSVVHSSLIQPEMFFYMDSTMDAEFHFVEQAKLVCFVGHTHVAGVYVKLGSFQPVEDWGCPANLSLDPSQLYLVNVGSVGQPRDRDWRASYVIFEPATRRVEWRRVEYDVALAREKISAAGLPAALGERILVGV